MYVCGNYEDCIGGDYISQGICWCLIVKSYKI